MKEIIDKIKRQIETELSTLGKEPTGKKKKWNVQDLSKKLLIRFFVLMAVLTVISRMADSITVARVQAEEAARGTLSFHITGNGVIEAGGIQAVRTLEGLHVEDILVEAGQNVWAGTPLLQLSMEDIAKKREELEKEIEKLEIQIRQETIGSVSEGITQKETAALSLEQAERNLKNVIREEENNIAAAQQDLDAAKDDLEKAKLDYDKALEKKSGTLLDTKTEAYYDAKKEYEDTKYTFESEIRTAQRKVQDAKKTLDDLNNVDNEGKVNYAIDWYNRAVASGDKDEIDAAQAYLDRILYGSGGSKDYHDNVEQAELALKRANDDLKAVKDKWVSGLDSAKAKFDKAEKELAEVKNGTYDMEEEMKNEADEVKAAEKEVRAREQALRKAQFNQKANIEKAQDAVTEADVGLSTAEKKDNAEKENEKKEEEKKALRIKALQLDKESKKIDLESLLELEKNRGIVHSPAEGSVSGIEAAIGKPSGSDAALFIRKMGEGFSVRGTISKDMADYLQIGDEMTVTLKGKKDKLKIAVDGIRYLKDEDEAEIVGKIPGGEYIPGASADIEIEKTTESYNQVVPLSAVREDGKGAKYILAVESRDTILGKQDVAVRYNITLLENDSKKAAIDAPVWDANIITSSSKMIGEGDRVRLEKTDES